MSSALKPPEWLLVGAVSLAGACSWGSCLCCKIEHQDLGGTVGLLAMSPVPFTNKAVMSAGKGKNR